MNKSIIPLILLLITLTVFTSGCETKTANQTWGEKKINLTLIEVSDNTTADHHELEGTQYYYVEGYLINKNPYDALDVKVKTTFYDAQGNIFGVNDTPYLETNNLPSNGNTYFFLRIGDPENKIVNYNVEVTNAKAQYGN